MFCYGFLSFGFGWVGFWILIWFRLDLDWLVGLAWWVVGCLVVFTMGLLGIWWVLFLFLFFFFGFLVPVGSGGMVGMVVVTGLFGFFNGFARFLVGICWVLFFLI